MSFHISRTPFRVSFFGGGTDYPDWYSENGGAVLSTTIDKFCYISCRYLPPFFNVRHRIVWSQIENTQTIGEIQHPAVREGLRLMDFKDTDGLEIHYQADLPARSGMGSSSSFAVGLIHALRDLREEKPKPMDLALEAIELERGRLKEEGGVQDQVAVAHGGFNVIRFGGAHEFEVTPVRATEERLNSLNENLLLFFTGTSRMSSVVAKEIHANLGARSNELRAMANQVDQALEVLDNAQDLDAFGHLLHEGWVLKRQLGDSVTNREVDDVYDRARDNGATGGKLLGAGGSGFMLFYVPKDRQADVKNALKGILHVPFAFESGGSTILYRPSDTDSRGSGDG